MRLGYPRLIFWTRPCLRTSVSVPCCSHLRLSSTASHDRIDAHGSSRLGFRPLPVSPFRCVLTVVKRRVLCSWGPSRSGSFLVFRVLSSTLLPGFAGPESSVYPWICHPLILPLNGFWRTGQPVHQIRRASWVRLHDLPVSRPASHRFDFPGYQASPCHGGSTFSPTPSSRFAVRYVHRFCLMLPSDTPFPAVPLPCWLLPFRPGDGGRFTSGLDSRRSVVHHASRT